ncbi:MAG: discoidin domain-containing protein [Parafilimonas sp.]
MLRITCCKTLLLSVLFYSVSSSAQKSVLTQHTDDARTGWYKDEIVLNQNNVLPGSFGKLFTRTVDEQMYAQPLVKCNLNIPGIGKRNVVFLETVNNSVYAYDADSANVSAPYWQRNLTPANARVINVKDVPGACFGFYHDFTNKMGIVGTPVIDTTTNTMYLIVRSIDTIQHKFLQHLHAMDIATGAEKNGSPVLITATINGSGAGSSGGLLSFNSQHQNQRPGLLLMNGIVFIAWSSHCDWGPYHGWVIGYDKKTLQQKYIYNSTPDGYNGGIWMSGGGPAADSEGNLYLGVGNGSVGKTGNPADLRNRSESVLKLTPSGDTLKINSFFTPNNFQALENADLDLGVSQVMLIPGTNIAMEAVKDGNIYVLDKDNMGGYNAAHNDVVQTIDLGSNASLRSSLAYYGGSQKGYAYSWSGNSVLNSYPFNYTLNNFDLANTVSSGVQGPTGSVGAFMAISSNGSADSTAILWTSYPATGDANSSVRPGILRAFAANDINTELWNSGIYYDDNPGSFAKFNCPTVCNGKVYLPTFSNQLTVFGLTGNKADTCATENIALNKTAHASSDSGGVYEPTSAFDGDIATRWISFATDPQYIYVDLGKESNLCRIALHWYNNNARDFKIQVSDDAVVWADVASVTNNIITDNYIPIPSAARYVRMYATKRADKNLGYSINEFEVFGQKAIVSCQPPENLYADSIGSDSATLHWTATSPAESYIVEYKTISAVTWNETLTIEDSIVLSNLACGTSYLFRVKSVCSATDTSEYSSSSAFTTLSCNGNCNLLPTRWYSEDIGNTGLPGQACYNAGVFELKGSGNDIGGTEDAFRFAYKTLVGDGEITARVLDQDATDKLSKCGIMVRESLAPDSRHAFIALAVDSGAVFETRSNTGGNTGRTFTSNTIKAPYWLRMSISGSTYTAYVSPDGASWTQVGTSTDAGFGNGTPVYSGLAVTSANNSILTTAHVDNYLLSGALPVQLLSFTASLGLNHTVLLEWKTTLETNTKYFAVERSSDNIHFSEIDRVDAANSGRFTVTYQSTDAHPANGINYYRLRMVDADNKITYSPIAVVRVSNSKSPLLYPNPAAGIVNIAQGDETIRLINLYDIAGRLLLSVPNSSSQNIINIPLSAYSNGLYFAEIRTETMVYMEKVQVRN